MKNQIHTQRISDFTAPLPGFFVAALAVAHAADPRTNSWLTAYSGKYARSYINAAAQTSGNAVTTWGNGSQTQSSPAILRCNAATARGWRFPIRSRGWITSRTAIPSG